MNYPSHDNAIGSRREPTAGRYRALSGGAVLSLGLGALSAVMIVAGKDGSGAFYLLLSVIPLAAIAAGWLALRRISSAPEERTGATIARMGIGLAAFFWIAGFTLLLMAESLEVPIGYRRVTYAELQPDKDVPGERIPQTAMDLKDKKVFLKGYIAPTRQLIRLKRFILCPTNGVCQFCIPNPKPTEMIRVKLAGDLTADYVNHLIGIGGRFHVDEKDPYAPYAMDVDYLK
jgi:hypothetical protein